MPIDFSPERWDSVRATYRRWWAGELDRPIIPVELIGRDPGRPEPAVPMLSQATATDLSISAVDVVDRLDYELAQRIYLGDAFPYINMDVFGPGIVAGFLGARVDNSSGRVWFFPPAAQPITALHFEYDPDNVWLNRVKELCAAAMARWQGQVLVGMTDLGGVLDVLSTFRPSERLLLDLYDYPYEVRRLVWEVHELWHRFYDEINAVLQPTNPGYSDWSRIYSDRPSYMLQSDFSYMIGPHTFKDLVKPELEASCHRLPYSFYHLDGVGQIPHLDALLAIETLDGVQWVPGDGKPGCAQWPELYQKIHAAGKKIQIVNGGFQAIDVVMAQVGSGTFDGLGAGADDGLSTGAVEGLSTGVGIHYVGFIGRASQEAEMRAYLARYGIT
jgi:hypothetical protein